MQEGDTEKSLVVAPVANSAQDPKEFRRAVSVLCLATQSFAERTRPPTEEQLRILDSQERKRQEEEREAEGKKGKKAKKNKKKKNDNNKDQIQQDDVEGSKSPSGFDKDLDRIVKQREGERNEIARKGGGGAETDSGSTDWWWSGNDIFQEVQVVRHAVSKCKRKNCIEETRKALQDAMEFDAFFFETYWRASLFREFVRDAERLLKDMKRALMDRDSELLGKSIEELLTKVQNEYQKTFLLQQEFERFLFGLGTRVEEMKRQQAKLRRNQKLVSVGTLAYTPFHITALIATAVPLLPVSLIDVVIGSNMSGKAEDFIDYPSEKLKSLYEKMEHCEWDFQEMVNCYVRAKDKVVRQLLDWDNLVKAVKACKEQNSSLEECNDEDWEFLLETGLPEELEVAARRYSGFLEEVENYLYAIEKRGMAPPLPIRVKEVSICMESTGAEDICERRKNLITNAED